MFGQICHWLKSFPLVLTRLRLATVNVSDDSLAIVNRVVAGEHTEEDLLLLRQILIVGNNQRLMQLGKYNVNIGQGQNIQIGDRIYQGTSAEAILKVLQEVLDARRLRTLLTHNEFVARVEQVALTGHQGLFVGREAICQELKDCLDGTSRIVILHGSGGLGKTRLLMALPEIVPEGRTLWYIRNEAESIEPELSSIERNTQHVIVVDDAHRFSLLYQLHEVLVNPELVGKVTLVLSTRSVFKDSIIYQLGTLPNNHIGAVEVKPLKNQDINQLLESSPYSITDQNVRYAIVKTAEGNPLFACIAARLTQQGVALANLTREQILTSYLDEIIKDLAEAERNHNQLYQTYIRYLQVLAALDTINLRDLQLQAKIYEVIGILPIDEQIIIARLVEAGLVEQYWKTIKIASEVLADHILIQHFFDSKTKRADYQKLIIEPFFHLKPKEIITNLAKAEFKGESSEAGLLLGQKLYELRRLLNQEGNLFRFNLLKCLRDVAYLKPDDIISIIASIVDAPEPSPETIYDQFWGTYEIGHEMVLSSAVEVLERAIYRGGLRDSITYLHKLALYRPEQKEYWYVRDKARKALIGIAEFKRHKPYGVQLLLLDLTSGWLKQDYVNNLPLCLILTQCMLKMDFHSTETNPIEPFTIVLHQGNLEIVQSLRQIRERSLDILYTAYQQAQDLPNRLQIVQALGGATPYLSEKEQISAQTLEQLQSDCVKTARFFSQFVIPSAELPVLDKVAEWLSQAQNFHKYQAKELDYLQQQLQNHSGYQLYRLLVGGRRWDDRHNGLDWQTATQQKQQKINEYVEAISPSNLEEVIRELEAIANQAFSAGRIDAFGLNDLLKVFGQTQFNLAQLFMEQVIAKNLLLKHHFGLILAGMRLSNQERARANVMSWIEQEDPVLWVAIAISYRFIDWSQPHLEQEWHILRQLVAKQSPVVDPEMFWSIQQLAPYKSDLAVELLKTLAARGDEKILHQVADTVSWQSGNNNEYAVKFENLQDLVEIIQNFERLSYLDYNAEGCLKRLADVTPMRVIDVIEQRIKTKPSIHLTKDYYQAFPQPFSRIFADIKSQQQYPEILRRIRDWLLQGGNLLSFEAPTLLKEIALNLEGKLYDVLMEWVASGDLDKLQAIANIMDEFNSGSTFYNLIREIIIRTQNENVLSSIHAAVGSTPDAIVGSMSSLMSSFYKQRIEEISPWLKDDNFQVRVFAKRVIQSFQIDIEREEGVEKLRERNW